MKKTFSKSSFSKAKLSQPASVVFSRSTIRSKAFTLLELMITVAIAGILAAIALPSFNNTIENSRLTAAANGLVGAFNLARSEAIRLASPVIVEDNGAGGWQVRDVNNVEALVGGIIKTFDAPGNGITLTAGAASITYLANGYRQLGGNEATFKVCNTSSICRDVIVSVSGNTKVEKS